MPYRKSYGKKKRYYKKKRPSTKQDAMTVAYAALRLGKKLARFVNTEIKYNEENYSNTVSASGTLVSAGHAIAIGDGQSDRTGTSIKPLRVTIRGNVTQHASATDTFVRLILIRGKQENASALAFSDIFDSTGTNQFKIWDKRFKTKILWDKKFQLCNTGTAGYQFSLSEKLYGHIQYDASDTTGATIENGGVYLLLVSTEATNTPTVNYKLRLTYVDN